MDDDDIVYIMRNLQSKITKKTHQKFAKKNSLRASLHKCNKNFQNATQNSLLVLFFFDNRPHSASDAAHYFHKHTHIPLIEYDAVKL